MNVEQYVLEIQETLRQQNYYGRKINYTEMQELHQTYGSLLPEKEFALYVLEIGINSYNGLKSGKYKTAILQKQLEKLMEEDAQKIKEKMLSEGHAGHLIDYSELQELHKTYAVQIPEDIFAKDILGILRHSYYELKAGKRKVYILRDLQKESSEAIESIREKLREDGYVGRKVSYLELQNLHIAYGKEFSESRFAQIVLEIPESSYLSAKNHNTNMIVLQRLVGKTPEDEIEEIRQVLKAQGYVGKTIDYIELQNLHQTYGRQMLEREFAQTILELTYAYYNTIRNNSKKRAIILKSMILPKISKEEVNKIREKIKEQGYEDTIIDYERITKTTSRIWKSNVRKRICCRSFRNKKCELSSNEKRKWKRKNYTKESSSII